MKKNGLLRSAAAIFCVAAFVLVFTGDSCGKDEYADATAEGVLYTGAYSVTYAGAATRVESICLSEKCNQCPTQDQLTLTITRNPDTVTLRGTGGCMAFSNKCETQSNDCGYTITGNLNVERFRTSYTFTGGNNGYLKCSGSGSFGDKAATVYELSCKNGGGEPVMTVTQATLNKQ